MAADTDNIETQAVPGASRKQKNKIAGAKRLPADHRTASRSLEVQAYEAIKERVVTLFFLPGQFVNEAAVAALLGMGRTPVHHAMQRLQLEGLVEVVPRKGIIIRPDSAAEILKILESREAVEPDLARRAAANCTDEQAVELRELALAADRHDGPSSIDSFRHADRAFHTRVAELSDNTTLAEFARLLHDRCMRFWYLHLWQTLDATASMHEHLAVSDAIAAHDGETAAKAMRHHISTLKERVRLIQPYIPSRQFALHKRPLGSA
jgi:DNA-binding GntR family transcriptional regulator